MTIHWCGTGLSSGPGLRKLIEAGQDVVVWNRTVEKARETVGDLTADIRPYSLEALTAAERTVFEQWQAAEAAAMTAAFGPHRYLDEARFEIRV